MTGDHCFINIDIQLPVYAFNPTLSGNTAQTHSKSPATNAKQTNTEASHKPAY